MEVYDINSNQITGAAFMGAVGLDWKVLAFGNFSGSPGETDMIMRNTNTGGKLFPFHSHGAMVPVTRISTAWAAPDGAFQVYNIANNQLTGSAPLGQVGSERQLGGFAPTFFFPPNVGPPLDSSSQTAAIDGSTAQLVQAMAGFGGGSGAGESLNPGGSSSHRKRSRPIRAFSATPQWPTSVQNAC